MVICSAPKGAKYYYDILVYDAQEPKCCNKWRERLRVEVRWKLVFKKIKTIKDVKSKWFQMRLVHRILGTNVILQKMNINDSDKCTFCHNEKENIQHIFGACIHVKNFWKAFENMVNLKCEHVNLYLTESIVLFGCGDRFKSDSRLLLSIFLIYKCRCEGKDPQCEQFILYLKKRYEIEKCIFCFDMSQEGFFTRWHPYLSILL